MTDFLLNCGGILFAVTLYSSSPIALNAALLLPALAILLSSNEKLNDRQNRPPKAVDKTGVKEDAERRKDDIPMKPFVTNYRGAMMMITSIAILAVDFRIFPRRFAKVENWGTSIMDMGVGSFVFSAGFVAAKTPIKERVKQKKSTLSSRLYTSARHSIPLFVLGIIRFYSVKGLDYAEHVTEYGVHWNFFFTLAFLGPLVAVVHSLFVLLPSYTFIALLITATHELALDLTNLTYFVVMAPRTDFISMNKEGVVSFAGYMAIFVAGIGTGLIALPRNEVNLSQIAGKWQFLHSTFGKLCVRTLLWIVLFELSTSYFGLGLSVSRRLANMPYVFWVVAFNTGQLCLYCGIENLCFRSLYFAEDRETELQRCRSATSQLLYSLNRNSLAIFLVANLLTGLVNQTLPTLELSMMQSMGVLVVHCSIFCGLALKLDRWDISIKL